MFQTFEISGSPAHGATRLAQLRKAMSAADLDGFIVPRADAHQGEYVAPCDARLAWLTGFTGSAGFCAVLTDEAGVFVDGRYRVQVKSDVDLNVFTPVDWPEIGLADWLVDRLARGARIGFDGWLHTPEQIKALRRTLEPAGIDLVPVDNLVDAVWEDRPPRPAAPMRPYPDRLAGRGSADKRAELAGVLRKAGQRAAVLSLPDSIAWLLNIRGQDIARVPVAQCFALLRDDGSLDLFAEPAKVAPVLSHLGDDVRCHAPDGFVDALDGAEGPVRVDRNSAPFAVADRLGDRCVWGDDPCQLPKATKTDAEIAGARAAHLRDGAAMCRFLHWLHSAAEAVVREGKSVTEIDVATELERARRATNQLEDISFETIAGAGPNGAIVHYRVNTDTDRALRAGELLLVDSGGQYMDGTTDITRTIAIGTPSADQRACFTRVLQGMIAVSRARWPDLPGERGIAGQHLDALARYPLWLAGQDYDHGTGHGVGSYLSVHEGPQGLSRRSKTPLRSGMILSNEPGYYREGAFGIRIENLLVVCPADPLPGGDDRDMLAFETLTWVPIDRALIAVDMLSGAEKAWIDGYHAGVADRLSEHVDGPVLDWLMQATTPL